MIDEPRLLVSGRAMYIKNSFFLSVHLTEKNKKRMMIIEIRCRHIAWEGGDQ